VSKPNLNSVKSSVDNTLNSFSVKSIHSHKSSMHDFNMNVEPEIPKELKKPNFKKTEKKVTVASSTANFEPYNRGRVVIKLDRGMAKSSS
jgi:hypothetical protein